MNTQQLEERIEAAKVFEISTGVPCRYIEFNKESNCRFRPCKQALCYLIQAIESYGDCKEDFNEGYVQAKRFGVPYIFYCHIGLVHVIAPIVSEQEASMALVCGPLLISDKYEYLFDEIAIKYKLNTVAIQDFLNVIVQIDTTPPHKVTALSKLLGRMANSLSADRGQLAHTQRNMHQSLTENLEGNYPRTYSIEKEKLLIASIKACDIDEAKERLNSILGDLFVIAGSNLEIIRTRVLELIVLLSRGAVEGGVGTEEIFGLNGRYIRQILELDNIEDLYASVNQMLIRFVESLFICRGMKHQQSIQKAVTYINRNYMNKLTLEEVAQFIYVSPTYFSKIFKEEMGTNFATYLNEKRIDAAKKLLQEKEIPLIDIVYLVGFEDQSYFSRVFKRYAGVSPKRYRESSSK